MLDNLPFTVTDTKDGIASVSFQVPVDFVETLPSMLKGLFGLFLTIKTRTRVAAAVSHMRTAEYIEQSQKRSAALSTAFIVSYDRHIASGLTPRLACAAVRDEFAGVYSITSIQFILRQAGRFSKRKGFQPL